MVARVLIGFPTADAPGLRAEAAQLALGLAACGYEVSALGALGPWRHALRRAGISATEQPFTGDTRRITRQVKESEPQILHAFGAATAHQLLPLAMLVGAGAVATLDHQDLTRLNPADFQQATAVFVPCDQLRDQLARRLPAPVIAAGNLLPPADDLPGAGNRFLAEELGLQEGAPLVLLADAFHGEETEAALQLIAAAPLLAARIPGLQLMLAGDGARLPELEAHAAEVNDRLGRRAVLLPGHRDDIPQLLALATVAVGSGRFALEAAGAGVAVIAAGAAGFAGVVTEESASVARFTCYGRHGRLEPVTARALATEIAGLYQYPDHRAHFAAQGQTAALAETERSGRAAQIAAYYAGAAAAGSATRAPQRITAILPDDPRELLFTLPALSGLCARYPLAKLCVFTRAGHQKLLEQLGLVERALLRPATFREWLQAAREQRPRADICLSFASDFASALLAALSFAPQRLGFVDGGGSLFFSDHLHARIPPSPERAQALVSTMGIQAGAPVPRPTLPPETVEMVALSLLAAGVDRAEPLILLSPQADEAHAWPADRWVSLAYQLLQARQERVAVLGGAKIAWPEGVIAVMPVQDSLVLAALLARAALLIAPDSSPLLMAHLMGTPAIGLYGPTSPRAGSLPGAQGRPICHGEYACHPCFGGPCTERHCLLAITPEEVLAAVNELRDGAPAPV